MIEMPTDDNPAVLILGDCMDILPQLAAGCVNMVCTDPPYQSLDVEVSNGTTTRLVRRDEFSGKRLAASDGPAWFGTLTDEQLAAVFAECERTLRNDGAFYVFADVKSGLRLFADWCRNVIVWDKGKIGMGYAWRRMHEWIGYRPMAKHKLRDMGAGDIIRCVGVDDKSHPTEKPIGAIVPLILNSTDPGDTILDPFAVSGSTAVACIQTGRRFLGCEIDPRYFAIAQKRINDALGVGSLFPPVQPVTADLFT